MTFGNFLGSVFTSKLFWTILITYLLGSVIKTVLHYMRFHRWSIKPFFDTGGMPSMHTAVTVALTTAVAFETGASALFFVCAVFTIIVIRDSSGVRKSVSDQAHILNALTSEMKIHRKARIVMGHTPFQVTVGFLFGIFVALAFYAV